MRGIIIAVAVAHFLLVLALFGVLKATGFTLITLFGSPPPLSGFQSLVFDQSRDQKMATEQNVRRR